VKKNSLALACAILCAPFAPFPALAGGGNVMNGPSIRHIPKPLLCPKVRTWYDCTSNPFQNLPFVSLESYNKVCVIVSPTLSMLMNENADKSLAVFVGTKGFTSLNDCQENVSKK
jgi:hypothetical protein